MSVDSVLDQAFTTLLAKAQQRQADAQAAAAGTVRPASINFGWGGGGAALVAIQCDPLLIEVPWPGEITAAHLYAGDATGQPVAVTATVTLVLTNIATFGASSSVTGSANLSLSGAASANLIIVGWQTSLITGDSLIARLTSFTGAATWLALVLLFRPSEVPLGVSAVVDENGNPVVDNSGNPVVVRG